MQQCRFNIRVKNMVSSILLFINREEWKKLIMRSFTSQATVLMPSWRVSVINEQPTDPVKIIITADEIS